MFGSKRTQATRFVTSQMQPLLGMLGRFNGIPAGFWQDDFVLGFFAGMTSFHLDRSRIALSTTDKGWLLFDVFSTLSHQNGQELGNRASRLVRSPGQSPTFDKGLSHAEAIALVTEGRARPEFSPLVKEALDHARTQGKPGDVGEVVAYLTRVLFYNEIEQRFGEE